VTILITVLGSPTRLGRLAIVCGVLAIIFGLVSAVSAAPQPGSTCKVAGRERVTSAGTLRCTESSGRSLRWVQVAPPSVVTTTTSTSSTTTTVAASARAPQVGAVSVDDSRVRFTLSGMTPDTGVYSVQWVERGSSFNTYQMVRATSRDVAISSQTFRCDRTYTFRVFVMRTGWTLADGHSMQNVTPHSEPFNVTMTHACTGSGTAPITTTTTIPLTCAQGGTCAVGDTGPGGGVVFILASTAGNTTGLTFEAARNDWDGASPDGTARWCGASNASIAGLGTAIGTGSSNSATIATTCASTGTLDAAEYVRGKTIGGMNDWFLPSRDEALEIYAQRSVFTGNYAINELTADTARYLTSSQGTNVLNSLGAYLQGSSFPGTSQDLSKNFNFSVRPVRSFTAGS
jgi:hypothetical protein